MTNAHYTTVLFDHKFMTKSNHKNIRQFQQRYNNLNIYPILFQNIKNIRNQSQQLWAGKDPSDVACGPGLDPRAEGGHRKLRQGLYPMEFSEQ